MVLLCYSCPQATEFDWVQFWSNVGIASVGIFAIIFSYLQYRSGQNANKRKEKRQDIFKKINEFYGPFLQLRKKSDILYDRFQEKFRKDDPKFSTLRYLMSGKNFEGNDKMLLEEIIKIGEKCENLIHDKAGLIDDTELRENILPKLTTHFLLLRLAFEGKLESPSDRFDHLSFPQEVDSEIEKRLNDLENELQELD